MGWKAADWKVGASSDDYSPTMSSNTPRIAMVTVDTLDAVRLGSWWARALGGTVVAENEGWFVVVALADGQPTLAFQKIDDPTPGKNRIHLDLTVADRDAAVRDLLAAGATLVAEQEMPDFSWVTLADPDGNQFCIASAAGH